LFRPIVTSSLTKFALARRTIKGRSFVAVTKVALGPIAEVAFGSIKLRPTVVTLGTIKGAIIASPIAEFPIARGPIKGRSFVAVAKVAFGPIAKITLGSIKLRPIAEVALGPIKGTAAAKLAVLIEAGSIAKITFGTIAEIALGTIASVIKVPRRPIAEIALGAIAPVIKISSRPIAKVTLGTIAEITLWTIVKVSFGLIKGAPPIAAPIAAIRTDARSSRSAVAIPIKLTRLKITATAIPPIAPVIIIPIGTAIVAAIDEGTFPRWLILEFAAAKLTPSKFSAPRVTIAGLKFTPPKFAILTGARPFRAIGARSAIVIPEPWLKRRAFRCPKWFFEFRLRVSFKRFARRIVTIAGRCHGSSRGVNGTKN
jgi:hypothetical protein